MIKELKDLQKVLTECVQAIPVTISIEMCDEDLIVDGWIHIKFHDNDKPLVRPEYVILLEKYYPATLDEPETTELDELCGMCNIFSIAEKVLDLALHNMISCILQSIGEQKAFEDINLMYEEWSVETDGKI